MSKYHLIGYRQDCKHHWHSIGCRESRVARAPTGKQMNIIILISRVSCFFQPVLSLKLNMLHNIIFWIEYYKSVNNITLKPQNY